MRSFTLLPAAALLLALCGGQAQAANYTFTGTLDSGPLLGSAAETFSGNFSFVDPATGFDGDVTLTSFTLDFNGGHYTLSSAAAGTAPTALFTAGVLKGVDFTAGPASASPVQMQSDWSNLDIYTLSYDTSGQGTVQGFGSYSFTAASVPEPGSYALLLTGLGLVGAVARRQRRA